MKKSSPGFTPLDSRCFNVQNNLRLNCLTGYTLLELILSVIIIAALVGISMPLFRKQFSDLEIRDSCYNIARFASFAQRKAIAEGLFFKLNFDFEKGAYWLTSGEEPDEFKRIEQRYGKIYYLPEDIEIAGKKRSFIYYPNGSSEKMYIVLRSPDETYTLESQGRLGRVQIKRVEYE